MKKIISTGLLIALFTMFTNMMSAQLPVLSFTPSNNTYIQGTTITPLPLKNTGGAVPNVYYGAVASLAGSASGASGSNNGTGTGASFFNPNSVTTDASGNVYVADAGNNLIRKITTAGVVTTLAGSGAAGYAEGIGTAAVFNNPTGVVVDATSSNLYVADCNNNRIRKIVIATGVTSLIAGSGTAGYAEGTGSTAMFSFPTSITINPSTGYLYVADLINCRIRQIIPSTGVTSSLAGTGQPGNIDNTTGATSSFLLSKGVLASDGVNIYLADWGNNKIRKIVIATGATSTLAGGIQGYLDASGTTAQFNHPSGIASDGTNLYVTDEVNNRIRKIVIATGVVTTFAGSGTPALTNGGGISASFYAPKGIAYDGNGHLYVADALNNAIRVINIFGYAYSALPAGLSFTNSSGSINDTISGTPTTAQSQIIDTFIAVNASGKATVYDTITIKSNPPVITSFSPLSGGAGTTITVNVSNLGNSGQIAAYIGGVNVGINGVLNQSTTSFSITLPSGFTTSGQIKVTSPGGTATSTSSFTFISQPSIAYAIPIAAACGQKVTIIGTNLFGTNFNPTSVSFGGRAASAFSNGTSSNGLTSLTATVGTGNSGNISVTNTGGTTTIAGFTYIPWSISSMSPKIISTGTIVTITGNNFQYGDTVASVIIGNYAVKSFTIVNNTTITAVMSDLIFGTPDGFSHDVVLTNTNGCNLYYTSPIAIQYLNNTWGTEINADLSGNLLSSNGKTIDGMYSPAIEKMNISTGIVTANSLNTIYTSDFSSYSEYEGGNLYIGGYQSFGIYTINAITNAITSNRILISPAVTDGTANHPVIFCQAITKTDIPGILYIYAMDSITNLLNIYMVQQSVNGSNFIATPLCSTNIFSQLASNTRCMCFARVNGIGYVYFNVDDSYGMGIRYVATSGSQAGVIKVLNSTLKVTKASMVTDGTNLYLINLETAANGVITKIPIATPTSTTYLTNNSNFPQLNGGTFTDITYDGINTLYMTDGNFVYSYNLTNSNSNTIESTIPIVGGTTNEGAGINLKVFPNPSSGTANLLIAGLKDESISSVSITNLSGQKVWSKESIINGILTLPTDNLPVGMYFISVNSGDQQKVTRWVKAR